jgi:putative phosphoribosyl transferase
LQVRMDIGVFVDGTLEVPRGAKSAVIFAHGSGSGRLSPRNRYAAGVLRDAGLGTLLFDLLTADEEEEDMLTGRHRFDIALLARRLVGVTAWLESNERTQRLALGYFGASTGAAAALVAAAVRADVVRAVVSRGGRPDLAAPMLDQVRAPTLLIVGGNDLPVIEMNRRALASLRGEKELVIVPGATHLFEEPGALEKVAQLAADWFTRYLRERRQSSPL